MKRAVAIALIFALSACMLFTSCGGKRLFFSAEDLIVPPLYYDEYGGLVETIQKELGKEIQLCTPSEGDSRSAIVFDDIDGDGTEEAIVFYRSGKGEENARMHIYDSRDDEWISCGDFGGYGPEIGSVTPEDMDKDGLKEIVVVWSVSGVAMSNVLSLYRTGSAASDYTEAANELCSVSTLADIDNDSYSELFFICYSGVNGVMQRFARALKLSAGTVVLMGEAKVDANISGYVSLKTEKASDSEPLRIYVDALKAGNAMITELIYWDGEKSVLSVPLYDPVTASSNATLRYKQLRCADINNDGIIDIPIQKNVFGDVRKAQDPDYENVYITEWANYSNGKLKTVSRSVVNPEDGYMLALEEHETEYLGARYYPSDKCLIVYDERSENDSELFSVMYVTNEQWDGEKYSSYIKIMQNDDGILCAYITQSGMDAGFNERSVKEKITKFQQNGG